MLTVAKTPNGYVPATVNIQVEYAPKDGRIACLSDVDLPTKQGLVPIRKFLADRTCTGWDGSWLTGRDIGIEILPEGPRLGGPQMKAGIAAAIIDEFNYVAFNRRVTHPQLMVVGGLSVATGITEVDDVEAIADVIPSGVIVGAAPKTASALQALGHKACEVWHLTDIVSFITDPQEWLRNYAPTGPPEPVIRTAEIAPVDISDVIGQDTVKWWFGIAAAGRHNVLPVGPHGQGKSMLARAIHGILPRLTDVEYREVRKVWDLAGEKLRGRTRPFRSVSRDVPASALLGGGTGTVEPGVVSLATRGVLHVDEFLELSKGKIESLRSVMEDRVVTVVRTQFKTTLPADFQLVGTANRCPCGRLGHPEQPCTCTERQRKEYAQKLSHAMAERIDLIVPIEVVPAAKVIGERADTRLNSKQYRQWVERAWSLQFARYGPGVWNGTARGRDILGLRLSKAVEALATANTKLTPRSLVKALRVARTIADWYGEADLRPWHLGMAIKGVSQGL